LGPWPYDDRVAHLVLLDHHMVPTTTDIAEWIAEAGATGRDGRTYRSTVPRFHAPVPRAGFRVADTLTLLERALADRTAGEPVDTARFDPTGGPYGPAATPAPVDAA
jgi:hypothetical protein